MAEVFKNQFEVDVHPKRTGMRCAHYNVVLTSDSPTWKPNRADVDKLRAFPEHVRIAGVFLENATIAPRGERLPMVGLTLQLSTEPRPCENGICDDFGILRYRVDIPPSEPGQLHTTKEFTSVVNEASSCCLTRIDQSIFDVDSTVNRPMIKMEPVPKQKRTTLVTFTGPCDFKTFYDRHKVKSKDAINALTGGKCRSDPEYDRFVVVHDDYDEYELSTCPLYKLFKADFEARVRAVERKNISLTAAPLDEGYFSVFVSLMVYYYKAEPGS